MKVSRQHDACAFCQKRIDAPVKALFVEEEVGRLFCNESCIVGYFTPDIERLEHQYLEQVKGGDLSTAEREQLAHLRWTTLQNPKDIWCEKMVTGDVRYTFISEYRVMFEGTEKEERVWCICLTLLLRGEPSFLFIAFVTRNSALVDQYRRGERVASVADLKKGVAEKEKIDLIRMDPASQGSRTSLESASSQPDIPVEEYPAYENHIEDAVQFPDEVWATQSEAPKKGVPSPLVHFIKHYSGAEISVQPFWYIVVARELDGNDSDQLEVLDAFPTRDQRLVAQYRKGTQQPLEETESPDAVPNRQVH